MTSYNRAKINLLKNKISEMQKENRWIGSEHFKQWVLNSYNNFIAESGSTLEQWIEENEVLYGEIKINNQEFITIYKYKITQLEQELKLKAVK